MSITRGRILSMTMAGLMIPLLSACDEDSNFNLRDSLSSLKRKDKPASEQSAAPGRTIERDVEAPEVFSATEAGLWDGRPSLGGVWVAHPDVKEPERVMIRNTKNGKFVVGALFRRERDMPGPRLQASSDAATALGMLAGSPTELNVTALRREEIKEDPVEVDTVTAPSDVSETPLDPIAAASAALEEPEEKPAASVAPKPKPRSSLSKPYLQVGIFSVEANANRTAQQMRSSGMVPTIRKGETGGKPFWRVIVGPAQSSAERKSLLEKIKTAGFTDAYAVTN